ncbi:MAG: hypothetical protein WCO35_03160 [Candidatus Nomurabacteria bacterium]
MTLEEFKEKILGEDIKNMSNKDIEDRYKFHLNFFNTAFKKWKYNKSKMI